MCREHLRINSGITMGYKRKALTGLSYVMVVRMMNLPVRAVVSHHLVMKAMMINNYCTPTIYTYVSVCL